MSSGDPTPLPPPLPPVSMPVAATETVDGGFPLGRLVALLTPVVATLMGGVATWLFEHFPGLQTVIEPDTTAAALTTGGVWLVTAVITWAMSHKWLDGLSKWERGVISDVPGDASRVG